MKRPNPKAIFRAALLGLSMLTGGSAFGETIRIGGTGVALGGINLLSKAFEAQHPDVEIEVLPSLGSSGGVKALLAGAIDVSLTSRDLKEDEVAMGARSERYATTPLVFVTSSGTQADGLTSRQIEDIYNGTITTWPNGEPIRIVLRPQSETDTATLRSLSAEVSAAVDAAYKRPGLITATTDQENAAELERLPGSLGLIATGQIATERRNLSVLTLDGVLPTEMNGSYGGPKFVKTLFLISSDNSSEMAEAFIEFVCSPEGQAMLETLDHVPVR